MYMRVAQKNPTNSNARTVHLSHALSMLNMKHSPSGHLSDTGPEPGIHSRMNSPFAYIVYPYIMSHPAQHIAMLCFVMLCLLYIYCFFPLFSPVDPKTDATPVIDYVDDDPSLLEQPGKPPPPLIISISPIAFSHDCIRFFYCYCLLLF